MCLGGDYEESTQMAPQHEKKRKSGYSLVIIPARILERGGKQKGKKSQNDFLNENV